MAWSITNKPAGNKEVINGHPIQNSSPVFPCTLVFLDSGKNIPEGTEQRIEAPYISMGRDSDCLVCYGEEFPMVSRLHAAIEWNNDSYSLRHLSATNQTLLNGRPISRKWFLHDGDVIQLAPSGPKLRFKAPIVSAPEKKKRRIDSYQVAMAAIVVLATLLLAWLTYLIFFGA